MCSKHLKSKPSLTVDLVEFNWTELQFYDQSIEASLRVSKHLKRKVFPYQVRRTRNTFKLLSINLHICTKNLNLVETSTWRTQTLSKELTEGSQTVNFMLVQKRLRKILDRVKLKYLRALSFSVKSVHYAKIIAVFAAKMRCNNAHLGYLLHWWWGG